MKRFVHAVCYATISLTMLSPLGAAERPLGGMLGGAWLKGDQVNPDCIRSLNEFDRAGRANDMAGKAAAYRSLRSLGCPVEFAAGPPPSDTVGDIYGTYCTRPALPDGHCPTLGQSIDYRNCQAFAHAIRKAIKAGDEALEASAYRKARRLGCALVERKR